MKNNMIALNRNDMEKVNGGYIFNASSWYGGVEKWQVIDEMLGGSVICTCDTREEAIKKAKAHRVSTREVGWDTILEFITGGQE